MKALIATLALAATTAAQAGGFITGNRLLRDMNRTDSIPALSFALGYVVGVHDALDQITHCSGPNVTPGQARDIVRDYLIANPATRDLNAYILVATALSRAWPCPTKPNYKNGEL